MSGSGNSKPRANAQRSGAGPGAGTEVPAPIVETATFRCFQAGYCSLEKYATSVDNVCEQVVDFLRDFDVAVQNIGLCILATGCYAFVEFHRVAHHSSKRDDGDDGGDDGDGNKGGSEGSGGGPTLTEEFTGAPGPSDRFGPWAFTHTFRKRVQGGARRDHVPTLISRVMAEAITGNDQAHQRRLVTFSCVLMSEVGCHVVLWHHGPEVAMPAEYALGFRVFGPSPACCREDSAGGEVAALESGGTAAVGEVGAVSVVAEEGDGIRAEAGSGPIVSSSSSTTVPAPATATAARRKTAASSKSKEVGTPVVAAKAKAGAAATAAVATEAANARPAIQAFLDWCACVSAGSTPAGPQQRRRRHREAHAGLNVVDLDGQAKEDGEDGEDGEARRQGQQGKGVAARPPREGAKGGAAKAADVRLVSVALARADFKRFLVASFYHRRCGAEPVPSLTPTLALMPRPTPTDITAAGGGAQAGPGGAAEATDYAVAPKQLSSSGGGGGGNTVKGEKKGKDSKSKAAAVAAVVRDVPTAAFKYMFPALRHQRPAGKTPTRVCVAQRPAAAADSFEATWAAFRGALALAADAVNAAPAPTRAGTVFRLAVGPSDDGVEVAVLHNQDDGHTFLPDTLPRPGASVACVLL